MRPFDNNPTKNTSIFDRISGVYLIYDEYLSKLDNISPKDRQRILSYKKYWDYYFGNHFEYYDLDYDTRVVANYIKRIINKISSTMFLKSPNYENIPEDLDEILKQILEFNDELATYLSISYMGSVCGDVWVYISFDERNNLPVFNVLNSMNVFPYIINNKVMFYDIKTLAVVDSITRKEIEDNYEEFYNSLNQPKFEKVIKTYRILRDKILIFIGNEKVDEVENILYPEFPIVHIQNIPLKFSYFSFSDVEPLIPINNQLNEKLSNLSEIIDYHAAPVTIVKGASVEELEKGVNKVWSNIPPEGDVYNLSLDTDLSQIINYIELLKEILSDLSSVPAVTLGKTQAISNTSAEALMIEYAPLIEIVKLKSLSYLKGIKEMIIKAFILMDKKAKNFSLNKFGVKNYKDLYKIKIELATPFPESKDTLLSNLITLYDMGLVSKKYIQKKLDLPDMEEDIKREKEEEAKFNYKLGLISAGVDEEIEE